MRARDALKLHEGDKVIDKKSGESIDVICAFEEECPEYVVVIEGKGKLQGYNHWSHKRIKES